MKKTLFLYLLVVISIIVFVGAISCSTAEPSGYTGTLDISGNFSAHANTHENGGTDEVNVAGLSGLLADDQHILDSEAISAIENANPLTLPAFTLGGSIIGNNKNITGINTFIPYYLTFGTTPSYLTTLANAGSQLVFQAHNGTSMIAVATIQSYTPPYFSLGGGLWKFFSDGLCVAEQRLVMYEIEEPDAYDANSVVIYPKQGTGDNLTDLCAKFQDGTVDIFAQETTPLDAPIFTYPDGTIGQLVLKKPHAGLVQIVMVFPDKSEFVIKSIEYHLESKILANTGCESELPEDWYIETDKEMADRLLLEATKLTELEVISK